MSTLIAKVSDAVCQGHRIGVHLIVLYYLISTSVVPRSRFLNFRETFTKSGGHTKSFKFLPIKLNSYPEISVHFLFKFELNVDCFGSRRGVDDSEVVSALALVLN